VVSKSILLSVVVALSSVLASSQTTATPATAAKAPAAPTATPAGQAISPDLERRLENTVRSYYSDSLPNEVALKFGERHPSEIPGFDILHVVFSSGDKHKMNDFLLSKDGNTLVRWLKIDVTPDPMTRLEGRPIRGNKDAKVTIVSYDDFECPYCSKMHQTLFPDLAKTYGDRIRFIYKDYPLDQIHPWAIHAAVDANCLAAQNNDAYWEFADLVHGEQKKIDGDRTSKTKSTAALDKSATEVGNKYFVNASRLQECVQKQDDSAVRASIADGDNLGVSATPTLFINGKRLEGAAPVSILRDEVDSALRSAGVQPPAREEKSAAAKAPADEKSASKPATAEKAGAASPAKN
jgi:protein-disulfide isomerase